MLHLKVELMIYKDFKEEEQSLCCVKNGADDLQRL